MASKRRVVRTVCGMCGNDCCGIDVWVEDGRITRIRGVRENPNNEGRLCVQSQAAGELVHHPDRLDYPLKRAGSDWQRITWDQALDEVAAGLQAVKARYGAPAFALWNGSPMWQFMRDGWDRRFLNLFGSPNWVQHDHMCYEPSVIAEKLTYGAVQVDGWEAQATRCLVLWGSNPFSSHNPYQWHAVQEAQRHGATLIVVDPRRSEPAARADLHLAPQPGSDAALALALLAEVISRRLYDADFVARWTCGFDALAERVAPYTAEWAEARTGVPAAAIRRFAELYTAARPAHLDAGNALEHHTNSLQTLRTLMILRAITGNLELPGGHVLGRPLPLPDRKLADRLPAGLRPLGADRHPLFVDLAGFVPGDVLIDAMLTGRPYPVKAAVIEGTNPMLTWPNSDRVAAALDQLDLLVVLDLFMTPTARRAHLVLPAASAYEKTQLISASGPHGPDRPTAWLALRRPIVQLAERRSEWWFWRAVAHRLGYGADWPWAGEEEAIAEQLQPLGLTVADLDAHPEGLFWGEPPIPRRYEQEGFQTPSGKVELYSNVLAAYGYDPLPHYEEPAESPASAPELAAAYPLVLNAGRRLPGYTHSRYRNLPLLRKRAPEPLAEIHPATAAQYGIGRGDLVAVETPRGAITLRASLTPGILPGVVGLVHGWEEANANWLTDYRQVDTALATPALRSQLCRVRKV